MPVSYTHLAEKEKSAKWLFSQEMDADGNPEGIGLSMWRVNLGAGSYLLVEESRAIGLRMGRNLAIGWNRIVDEFCQAVSLHPIAAL